MIRAATGFPLIVLSPKSAKPNAGKVASVGCSFPAGFVAFTAYGLSATIPAAAHRNLSVYESAKPVSVRKHLTVFELKNGFF